MLLSMHSIGSEEIRAGALMLSRLGGMPKRSIAFVEPYHDEMPLVLCSTAGHPPTHGHTEP